MAINSDLVLMARVLINDISEPQTYSDEYLSRVIVTAGILADAEVEFAYDYVYDIGNITISPDPVTSLDTNFQALVPLKAACIITQGEFKQALGQGIKVRDGDSAIDTSVSFRGYKDILELGPCKAYERLQWTLLASSAYSGGAVLGPHRVPGGDPISTISWYYDTIASWSNNGRRDRT